MAGNSAGSILLIVGGGCCSGMEVAVRATPPSSTRSKHPASCPRLAPWLSSPLRCPPPLLRTWIFFFFSTNSRRTLKIIPKCFSALNGSSGATENCVELNKTMKLLEDHLRTLCPGATLGNLAPGFSHYFQPGVTLLVSVGVVVVLVLRSGLTHFEKTCSVGCHVEVHAFAGFIITGSTLTLNRFSANVLQVTSASWPIARTCRCLTPWTARTSLVSFAEESPGNQVPLLTNFPRTFV